MPDIMYRWVCTCGASGYPHSHRENAQMFADEHQTDCPHETTVEPVEIA